jgi:hypothetical protein
MLMLMLALALAMMMMVMVSVLDTAHDAAQIACLQTRFAGLSLAQALVRVLLQQPMPAQFQVPLLPQRRPRGP